MESTERFDVILLGTGITECLLGCLMAKEGKKVLQLDRERFNGGANGSISSLEELQEKVSFTISNIKGEWNVDLIPKLFVGRDRMARLLEYLGIKINTKPIQSIYFASKLDLFKVPNSEQQIDMCGYIPKEEKESFKKLINQAKTLRSMKFGDASLNSLQQKYNLGPGSKTMLYQGMVYEGDESTGVEKAWNHLQRFCDVKHYQPTSVKYPLYGIGDILQALQKKFSSNGGRCMLNRPINKVNKSGGMVFVSARGLSAMARVVVGDPSYFSDLGKPTQKVIRCLCVLDHSIAGTDKAPSSFITIPGTDHSRKHDIYICQTGTDHNVSPRGYFLVHISTVAETLVPNEEIQPALEILGEVCASTVTVEDVFVCPKENQDNTLLVSSSYDSSMNWESVYDDVERLYARISGNKLSKFDI